MVFADFWQRSADGFALNKAYLWQRLEVSPMPSPFDPRSRGAIAYRDVAREVHYGSA